MFACNQSFANDLANDCADQIAERDQLQTICIQHARTYPRILRERHHKLIRGIVSMHLNHTKLEQSMAEELLVHALHDLRAQPATDGFVAPHAAPPQMVDALQRAIGCPTDGVMTCGVARSGAVKMHVGDVVIYTFDGHNMHAGDIYFFASAGGFEESAFVAAWERKHSASPGVWKFDITADLVRVPVRNVCGVVIAFVGDNTATLICPDALNYL